MFKVHFLHVSPMRVQVGCPGVESWFPFEEVGITNRVERAAA
jgi:hypothetical protein